VIPDGEKITSRYLREHADVAALVDRVVGKTPDTTSTPWVRLTQLDATNAPGSRREHLISYLLQLDCYAGADGGQPEAKLLARTVRAALELMPDATHDGAVCTSVRIVGDVRRPDTDFEKARERVILTAIVHLHAA
jgi:hypothetical protein